MPTYCERIQYAHGFHQPCYNQDTNRLRVGIRGENGGGLYLFTWILDAWKLHQGNMSQLQFRREITTVYLRGYGIAAAGRGRQWSAKRRSQSTSF